MLTYIQRTCVVCGSSYHEWYSSYLSFVKADKAADAGGQCPKCSVATASERAAWASAAWERIRANLKKA